MVHKVRTIHLVVLLQTNSTETGVKTTAEVSQASAANMTALQNGDGEVAFVQTDIAFYATEGNKC